MDETVEIDKHEFKLNHIVLPRYLPQKNQDYSEQMQLVHLMLRSVIAMKTLPINTIQLFEQLKRIYVDAKEDALKDAISKEIKTLRPNDTFAMFVRRQNCTLIIHKKEKSVILATFHSAVKPIEVYRHASDIEVNILSRMTIEFDVYRNLLVINSTVCFFQSIFQCHYPSNAIEVKSSVMLKSDYFIEQLCILHTNSPPESANRDYVSNW